MNSSFKVKKSISLNKDNQKNRVGSESPSSNRISSDLRNSKYNDLVNMATKPLIVQGMPPLPIIQKQRTTAANIGQRQTTFDRTRNDQQAKSFAQQQKGQLQSDLSNQDLKHHLGSGEHQNEVDEDNATQTPQNWKNSRQNFPETISLNSQDSLRNISRLNQNPPSQQLIYDQYSDVQNQNQNFQGPSHIQINNHEGSGTINNLIINTGQGTFQKNDDNIASYPIGVLGGTEQTDTLNFTLESVADQHQFYSQNHQNTSSQAQFFINQSQNLQQQQQKQNIQPLNFQMIDTSLQNNQYFQHQQNPQILTNSQLLQQIQLQNMPPHQREKLFLQHQNQQFLQLFQQYQLQQQLIQQQQEQLQQLMNQPNQTQLSNKNSQKNSTNQANVHKIKFKTNSANESRDTSPSKTKKDELDRKFKQEQRKLGNQLLKFGADDTAQVNQLSVQIKEAQSNVQIKNKQNLANMVNEHMNNDLQEAIKGLASIDNYTQKYVSQNKKGTTVLEFDPSDRKQLKQVQRAILKIESEMRRDWNTEGRKTNKDAQQSKVHTLQSQPGNMLMMNNTFTSTITPLKTQKNLANLMGLDQTNGHNLPKLSSSSAKNQNNQQLPPTDMLLTLTKDRALSHLENKGPESSAQNRKIYSQTQSVERNKTNTLNFNNNQQSQENTRLFPGQNQFTLQLPELQQRIQNNTQSLGKVINGTLDNNNTDYNRTISGNEKTQIRDVNYINVFIQPHHNSLKKIKQSRSQSAKDREQQKQNDEDAQQQINKRHENDLMGSINQEGVVDIFKGDVNENFENQTIRNGVDLRDDILTTDLYLDTIHRRSLLLQQTAAGQIDLESIINKNLEGQDFLAYIDAILYHSPLFESMAKQTNKLETLLADVHTESQEGSPKQIPPKDSNSNTQKNQKNSKPPKSKQLPDQIASGSSSVQNPLFNKLSVNNKVANEHSQQRIEATILNQVLDQVLTGKFYYHSNKMSEKRAEEELRYGLTAKYLSGFDFKQLLLEQSKISYPNEGKEEAKIIHSLDMLPIDPSILDSIFSIERIKEFESKIRKLLQSTDDEDAIVTFLTQEFQPTMHLPEEHLSDQLSTDPDQNHKNLFPTKNSIETFNTLTQRERNKGDEVERTKEIVIKNAHQKHVMIKNIIKSINQSNSEIINLQEMRRDGVNQQEIDPQSLESQTKRMLYLCFLEMVRQISTKCKEQGLILIKIWHSYFDQVEKQIRNLLKQIKQQTVHLTSNMENLMQQVTRLIEQKEDKELKFVDLKINYEKTQHVLSIATRLIHNEEDRHKAGKDRYEKLKSNITLLFPRYQRYIDDEDLHEQIKLMIETKGPSMQQLDHQAYKEVNEQFLFLLIKLFNDRKIDPYEEDLILDMERLQRYLQTKTPQGIKIDQLNQNYALLQKSYDDLAMAKFNQQVEFNNHELECREKVVKMEEEAISQTLNAEQLERQIRVLQQQLNFLKDKYVSLKVDEGCQTYISMSEMPKNTVPVGVTKHNKFNSNASSMHHNTQKLRQIEATQELIEAFKAQPPLEKVYTPIRNLMKIVREGKSTLGKDTKTIKKTLAMIGHIIQAKIVAMDKNDKFSLMNMDHYYYEYMNHRFGLGTLAKKYCEIYLMSFQKHREADSRIELFRKLIGLDRDRLPYSIFCSYVKLIKSANFSVNALFTSNITNFYIEYNYAKSTLLSMVLDAAAYIPATISSQLKRYAKVLSDNKKLSQGVEINEYQMFKEFIEKITQSKYRNINDFVTPLYQTVPFVTVDKLRDYILNKFDFGTYTNPDTKTRLQSMIKTFFVDGLDASPNNIPKDGLMQTVRTKFEMKLPVSAFLHIGMNAVIEHENNENIWMEGIYQFYTTVETDYVQQELGQFIRQSFAINGLSFEQFVFFMNDCESPRSQQQIIEIYRNTCEQHYRILMACDDFIEAVSKYKLVLDKKVLEQNKLNREKELKRLQQGLSLVEPDRKQSIAGVGVNSMQIEIVGGVNTPQGMYKSQFKTSFDIQAEEGGTGLNPKETLKNNQTGNLATSNTNASKPLSGADHKKLSALQNIRRQSSTVGKFKAAVTQKSINENNIVEQKKSDSAAKQQEGQSKTLSLLENIASKKLKKPTLKINSSQDEISIGKISNTPSVDGKKSSSKLNQLIIKESLPAEQIKEGLKELLPPQIFLFNNNTRSTEPLMFQSTSQPNIMQNSMMKQDATFYSQKAGQTSLSPNNNQINNEINNQNSKRSDLIISHPIKNKYLMRTTLSKINLEIISRDEDLAGDKNDDDSAELMEDPNLEDIKRQTSSGFREVQVQLTGQSQTHTGRAVDGSDNIENNSVFDNNDNKQQTPTLQANKSKGNLQINMQQQQKPLIITQSQNNEVKTKTPQEKTSNVSEFQIHLETIQEEKYNYQLLNTQYQQKKDLNLYDNDKFHQLDKNEIQEQDSPTSERESDAFEQSDDLVKAQKSQSNKSDIDKQTPKNLLNIAGGHSLKNSFEEQILSDQSKSQILNSLDQMQQILNERRVELQQQSDNKVNTIQIIQQEPIDVQINSQNVNQMSYHQQKQQQHQNNYNNTNNHQNQIVIRESEQLINWNDSPIPKEEAAQNRNILNPNSKGNLQNKSVYKSHDSTLEMILNRNESQPIRSQTLEIINALRIRPSSQEMLDYDQFNIQNAQYQQNLIQNQNPFDGQHLPQNIQLQNQISNDQNKPLNLLGNSALLPVIQENQTQQLKDYSISEISRYDHSPMMMNVGQSTPKLLKSNMNTNVSQSNNEAALIHLIDASGANGQNQMGRGSGMNDYKNSQARKSLETNSKILLSSQTGKESLNYTEEISDNNGDNDQQNV